MLKNYSIADTFGITAPASMKVEGFEPSQNPYVPKEKSYVFRKDHLRDVLAFLGSPNGDGLYLTGPTGSGKRHCWNKSLLGYSGVYTPLLAMAGWNLMICWVSTCWSMAARCNG